MEKYKKFNEPKKRSTGYSLRACKICGRIGPGHIQAYNLHLCRQCFRENAKKLGFKKYR